MLKAMTNLQKQDHLDQLESESIAIIRQAMADFCNPVLLYSVGKDSSVLLHLTVKAFLPAKPGLPLLHIDTGYKFQQMLEFRDKRARELGFELTVHRNEAAIAQHTNPYRDGVARCCGALKTQALLDALEAGNHDAAIGGARRDEEASRAKERVFSFRDTFGQWEPRGQRPELWNNYNTRIHEGESMRIFPLSNWTEVDIWSYIQREGIAIVPLYFAKLRKVRKTNSLLMPAIDLVALPHQLADHHNFAAEPIREMNVRYRTLGCTHCTAACESNADTLQSIVDETMRVRTSERSTRLIDHGANSMEDKKREGYF